MRKLRRRKTTFYIFGGRKEGFSHLYLCWPVRVTLRSLHPRTGLALLFRLAPVTMAILLPDRWRPWALQGTNRARRKNIQSRVKIAGGRWGRGEKRRRGGGGGGELRRRPLRTPIRCWNNKMPGITYSKSMALAPLPPPSGGVQRAPSYGRRWFRTTFFALLMYVLIFR